MQVYTLTTIHVFSLFTANLSGMLSKMDDSIGEIVSALSKKGILDNSVIIFSTDNGGPAAGFDNNAASNWPLRGVCNCVSCREKPRNSRHSYFRSKLLYGKEE